MKENWYEEFIESKGLVDEYNEFKERMINGCNGIAVNFDVMLGDGDGNYEEEVLFPKHVVDDFVKDPLTAEKYVRRREKVGAIDEECTVQK